MGQINGVYGGTFITPKNALRISAKDTLVSGVLFEDKFNSYPFQGYFSHDRLRGYFVKQEKASVISGALKNDTLRLNLIAEDSDSIVRQGLLVKISSKPNFSIERIYKEEKLQYDKRLIGTWENVKSVDADSR